MGKHPEEPEEPEEPEGPEEPEELEEPEEPPPQPLDGNPDRPGPLAQEQRNNNNNNNNAASNNNNDPADIVNVAQAQGNGVSSDEAHQRVRLDFLFPTHIFPASQSLPHGVAQLLPEAVLPFPYEDANPQLKEDPHESEDGPDGEEK